MDETPRDRVLALARSSGSVRSGEIAGALGITRQAAHAHLRALVDAGELVAEGEGRGRRYRPKERVWRTRYSVEGLEEDAVWRDQLARVPPLAALAGDGRGIFQYALTELVNNAIDHSGAPEIELVVSETGGESDPRLSFEVIDAGAGVFEHVRRSLGLATPLEALQELSKGKTTTLPSRHTGEGIFFTSKAGDRFELESGALRWVVDNERGDYAVGSVEPPRVGTRARFEARPARARPLAELFHEYTEDYEFTKTRTVVKLFAIGVEFVSRSEAKRLVSGLDKFREVVLDFTGVELIGQGFADEVFRVWQREHPEVGLLPVHMSEPVAFMVERARRAR